MLTFRTGARVRKRLKLNEQFGSLQLNPNYTDTVIALLSIGQLTHPS